MDAQGLTMNGISLEFNSKTEKVIRETFESYP
jgi:hypothetical protein